MTPFHIRHRVKSLRKAVCITVLTAFIGTSVQLPLYAQTVVVDNMPWMPKPGVRVELSSEFTPAHLKGMVIHPDNALQFDFIIHRGDEPLSDSQKQDEYKKLVKYFLASLAIPDDNQWVNLSPFEKDRIIKEDFGKTEMGRDLLAQDYILKQITASMIYPESNLGKTFWDKVYAQAQQQFGSTNIPINTFNKVWITPDEATVYEKGNTVYVLKNHLKVMLEQDYLSLSKHAGITSAQPEQGKEINNLGGRMVREIILPAIEKEVNEGKNFAMLRQVYSAMILAAWYKRSLKESLLGKIYLDQAKVKGIDQKDPKVNEQIYQQYLKAFKKGVFNFIKEDVDKFTNESIPRKYFSGGIQGMKDYGPGGPGELKILTSLSPDQQMSAQEQLGSDEAMSVVLKESVRDIKKTIFLIDDNQELLSVHKNLLETYNFNVLTASTPEEVRSVWDAHKDEIRAGGAVLADTNRGKGEDQWPQVVQEILGEYVKTIPIYTISGREENQNPWTEKGVPVKGFLKKGSSIVSLIEAIDRELTVDPIVIAGFKKVAAVNLTVQSGDTWKSIVKIIVGQQEISDKKLARVVNIVAISDKGVDTPLPQVNSTIVVDSSRARLIERVLNDVALIAKLRLSQPGEYGFNPILENPIVPGFTDQVDYTLSKGQQIKILAPNRPYFADEAGQEGEPFERGPLKKDSIKDDNLVHIATVEDKKIYIKRSEMGNNEPMSLQIQRWTANIDPNSYDEFGTMGRFISAASFLNSAYLNLSDAQVQFLREQLRKAMEKLYRNKLESITQGNRLNHFSGLALAWELVTNPNDEQTLLRLILAHAVLINTELGENRIGGIKKIGHDILNFMNKQSAVLNASSFDAKLEQSVLADKTYVELYDWAGNPVPATVQGVFDRYNEVIGDNALTTEEVKGTLVRMGVNYDNDRVGLSIAQGLLEDLFRPSATGSPDKIVRNTNLTRNDIVQGDVLALAEFNAGNFKVAVEARRNSSSATTGADFQKNYNYKSGTDWNERRRGQSVETGLDGKKRLVERPSGFTPGRDKMMGANQQVSPLQDFSMETAEHRRVKRAVFSAIGLQGTVLIGYLMANLINPTPSSMSLESENYQDPTSTELVPANVSTNGITSLDKKGGIDLNAVNLNLHIKRDGKGIPLPISQQDLEHINIDGLIPVIIDIKPAASLSIFSELKNS